MSIEYEDLHIFQEIAKDLDRKNYLLNHNEVWNNFIESCSVIELVFIDIYFHEVKEILREHPVQDVIKEVQQGNGSNISFLHNLFN